MDHLARPANSCRRNHSPGKIFRIARAWKCSINHSEPNVARQRARSRRRGVRFFPPTPSAAGQWGTAMAAKAKPVEADVEETGPEAGGEEPQRKLPLKLIAIALGAAILLAGAGTAGYLLFFRGDREAKAVAAQIKPTTFLDVPEVL